MITIKTVNHDENQTVISIKKGTSHKEMVVGAAAIIEAIVNDTGYEPAIILEDIIRIIERDRKDK